jgi:hypothetical protein
VWGGTQRILLPNIMDKLVEERKDFSYGKMGSFRFQKSMGTPKGNKVFARLRIALQ